jgi:MinD-like ATPase involved in chromosome partitioning or flagellar assembly
MNMDLKKEMISRNKYKVISFYSFKGGSGRSVSLANIAYHIAKNKKVGCIDFDFESAGLNFIYKIPQAKLDRRESIQDFAIEPKTFQDKRVQRLVVDVGEDYNLKSRQLLLIPACTDEQKTSCAASKLDAKFFTKIMRLINDYVEEYHLDYVFIDARSGISQMAWPSLVYADKIIIFFKPSNQHLEGTGVLAPWTVKCVREYRGGEYGTLPLKVGLVASCIPYNQEDRFNSVLDRFLFKYNKELKEGNINYLGMIHENDGLKFDEEILTAEKNLKESGKEYVSLAKKIMDL